MLTDESGSDRLNDAYSVPVDLSTSASTDESAFTTVAEWRQAQTQGAIAINDIQFNSTETGVDVVLELDGQIDPTTSTVGNDLIIDIPNVVLTTDRMEQLEPADGIARISVENVSGNQVRVVITGTESPPVVGSTV
ncbi:MAG: AMIN domain-containing protein [Cyanobacteria bacterium P01_F01_bin.150]